MTPDWFNRLLCRLAGHRWTRRGRNGLGLTTRCCRRCGLWDQEWDW